MNQSEFDAFRKRVKNLGGGVRVDGTGGVNGSSAGVNHAQVEGFGKSISSRHIWLRPGVF